MAEKDNSDRAGQHGGTGRRKQRSGKKRRRVHPSGRRVRSRTLATQDAIPAAIGPGLPIAPPNDARRRRGRDLGWYVQVVRNRRKLVLATFAVVLVTAAAISILQTPTYRATGTLEIRRTSDDGAAPEEASQLARISDQYLATQYEILRSPTLARRVALDVDLWRVEEFNPDAASVQPAQPYGIEGIEEPGEGDLWNVVNAFSDRLSVRPVKGSRLVAVDFESKDPQLAAKVVNSIFDNFVELRKEAALHAFRRLATEVDSTRAEVSRAEQQLQEFIEAAQLKQVEANAGEIENALMRRLEQLQEQLAEAEAELYRQEARWDLVQQGNYEALDSRVMQGISVPMAQLEGEYSRLRTIFTDDYPRTKQVKSQLDALREQAARARTQVASEVRSDYHMAVRRHDRLREAVEEQKRLLERFTNHAMEYRTLRRVAASHEDLYQQLVQKEREAGVSAALTSTQVTVVDPAIPPRDPVRPSHGFNLALATFLGLLLGVGVAFGREYADPRVHSVEEIDELGDVPILALIPSARAGAIPQVRRPAALSAQSHGGLLPPIVENAEAPADSPWVRIDHQDWKRSALADAFGNLRTSVLFESNGPPPRALLVSSVRAGEGKTTVSVNLAISLARLGRKVLLVDADVRRPSVHRAFAIETYPGLAEYLAGTEDWRRFVRPQTLPGLDILPSGRTPDNPAELLSTERMRELIAGTKAEYDFVVVDAPALLVNVADARILAPLADGIVVVVRNGVTPRELLKRILRQTPNVVGLVMNDLHASLFANYYQAYPSLDDDEAEHASWIRSVPRSIPKLWRTGAETEEAGPRNHEQSG